MGCKCHSKFENETPKFHHGICKKHQKDICPWWKRRRPQSQCKYLKLLYFNWYITVFQHLDL